MEFRRACGRCRGPIADDDPAYHCALDCTYCATCAKQLDFVCPNCSGELVRRPRPRGSSPPAARPPSSIDENSVSVRLASRDDLDALAPLFDAYRQFYDQASDPAAGRRFLEERVARGESVVLLAEHRGRAVGFVQLFPYFSSTLLRPIEVLNDLYVAPDARRHGVGGALLEAARSRAENRGLAYLELTTAVDNPAQRLYEAHGWMLDRAFLHYELLLQRPPEPARAPAGPSSAP